MFAFYDADDNKLIGHAEAYLPCELVKLGNHHEPHAHNGHLHFCDGYPSVVTYTLETSWPWFDYDPGHPLRR